MMAASYERAIISRSTVARTSIGVIIVVQGESVFCSHAWIHTHTLSAHMPGYTHTHKTADRQTDRRTDRQTHTQTRRQADRQANRQKHKQTRTDRCTDIDTWHMLTAVSTDRQTDAHRPPDRKTHRQTRTLTPGNR